MANQTQEVSIPDYVLTAFYSCIAQTQPYTLLNAEQWTNLAEHVLADEIIPHLDGTNAPFLPRGTQNSYGHGRKDTLDGILNSAVAMHKGAEEYVPHYETAQQVYERVRSTEEVRTT